MNHEKHPLHSTNLKVGGSNPSGRAISFHCKIRLILQLPFLSFSRILLFWDTESENEDSRGSGRKGMATFEKRGDLQWRAKVRRRGFPLQTRTFFTKADAEA